MVAINITIMIDRKQSCHNGKDTEDGNKEASNKSGNLLFVQCQELLQQQWNAEFGLA
jgi:hypothetical protein